MGFLKGVDKMKKLRLLLIDDNPNDRALALRELKKEFQVKATEIKDAKGFNKVLKKFDFDIVIIDYQLGWATGLEILNALKASYPSCPVIMYTGTGTEEIAVEAMKKGLDDYIVKSPKHFKRLPTAVSMALERGREHQRRKDAEEALRASEEKYRNIFDNVKEMVIYVSKYGKIIDVNERVEDIFGFKRDEVIGKNFMKLGAISLKQLPRVIKLFRHAGKVGKVEDTTGKSINLMEFEVKRKNGKKAFIETSTTAIKKDGKLEGFLSIIRDISERKQGEEKLKESETKYRTIIENINDALIIHDFKGKIIDINENTCKLFGYDHHKIIGKKFSKFTTKESAKKIKSQLKQLIKEGFMVFDSEAKKSDGAIVPINISAKVVSKKDNGIIQSFIRDITNRKQADEALRESKEKYHNLIEGTFDIVQSVNPDGSFNFVNRAWHETLGYTKNDLKKITLFDIIHPESLQKCKKLFSKVITGESITDIEASFISKDGRKILIEGNVKPRFLNDKIIATHGFFRDVTDRKRTDEKLQSSLREKEVLLREIHHRVKNNLQIISSLLDMGSMRTSNHEAIDLFTDASAKVHTMAIIHSQLYRSERFDQIDMESHIQELVDYLSQTYAAKKGFVTSIIEQSHVRLPVIQAIPCALALNEAIANSFKHAFKEVQKGTIVISMQRSADNTIFIRGKDDGIGIPKEIDIHRADSLGLKLMRNLVQEQLNGKLQVKRNKGTEIIIEFKALKEETNNV